MKIPIWKTAKNTYFLHIYSQYYCPETVISIGSDCHSAYILNAVGIRKQSFVFDWLFSNSKFGIKYVNDNIKNQFSSFLENLTLNHRNYIISENYPYTEFFHEPNLINSESDRQKMKRRALRFLSSIKKPHTLLYVINHQHFSNEEDISFFINSLKDLQSTLSIYQNNSKIKLFIKYNNIEPNGLPLMDKLISECDLLKNIQAEKYFLDSEKFGAWGNGKDYFPLLKSLGINIRKTFFPKIFIK